MKKNLFISLLMLLPMVAVADSVLDSGAIEIGGIAYNFDANAKVAEVTNNGVYGGAYTGSVVIPEKVEYNGVEYTVTSIGYSAFNLCNSLTEITIPNSVTTIEKLAFFECMNLTSVSIGNSVTSIGEGAFQRCSALTSVTIPNSVTSIGDVAFSGCASLTSITIPGSVTSLGVAVFSGCNSLASIKVEASNTKYDSRDGCNAIIETESNRLIAGCQNTIILATVTSIGKEAFGGCNSLSSITIPGSVTSIGNYAFGGCTGLTSITIGNGVTSIGEQAFTSCRSLKSIAIPNSVTSIGKHAFTGCESLKYITSRIVSPFSIDDSTFDKSTYQNANLTVPEGTASTYKAMGGWKKFWTIDEFRIVEDRVEIGDIAYDLDANAKVAKVAAGRYCTGSVVIPEKVEYNGVEYSVTSIGNRAFYNCSGLTSITIPNSVTIIEEEAFMECKNLTSVTIGNSVKSIGFAAFYSCSALTSITIPNSVTSIGTSAFNNCIALTSITIPNSVTSIGQFAFWRTGWYNNQSDGVLYLDKWLICFKGKLAGDYSIAEGTAGIAGRAFYQCEGLTSITIPSSVTSIGEFVFSGCTSLTAINVDGSNASYVSEDGVLFNKDKLTLILYPIAKSGTAYAIPSSVTSIESSAFTDCTALTSITIPNSVTSIESSAFAGCTSLTSITIPNSVTSIGYSAFKYCKSMTSVSISNNVTTIGQYAFSGCRSLTSVTIPNSVTNVSEGIFAGCSSLTDVSCLAENVPDTDIGAFKSVSFAFLDAPDPQLDKVTLHVPAASIDAYKAIEPWSGFKEVVALTDQEMGIHGFTNDSKTEVARYTIGGQRVNKQRKGLNIIRMSDGTTKKVVVK